MPQYEVINTPVTLYSTNHYHANTKVHHSYVWLHHTAHVLGKGATTTSQRKGQPFTVEVNHQQLNPSNHRYSILRNYVVKNI